MSEKARPIFERACQHSPKDEVKGRRKGPFVLNIIDEEGRIGRNAFGGLVTRVTSCEVFGKLTTLAESG